MKALSLIFGLLLVIAAQLLGQSDQVAGLTGNGPSTSTCLVLSVRLRDPFNRDFEMRIPVGLGQRFRTTATNGTVRNEMSGRVGAANGGKYALNLTVLEWQSAKNNVRDTTNFRLELDKPQSAGPISSFVYLRTVTLSRKQRRCSQSNLSEYQGQPGTLIHEANKNGSSWPDSFRKTVVAGLARTNSAASIFSEDRWHQVFRGRWGLFSIWQSQLHR